MSNSCSAFGCLNLPDEIDDGSCDVCQSAPAAVVGLYGRQIQHVCGACAREWALQTSTSLTEGSASASADPEFNAAACLWAQGHGYFPAQRRDLAEQVTKYKQLCAQEPTSPPPAADALRAAERAYSAAVVAAMPFLLAYFAAVNSGSSEQVARRIAAQQSGQPDPLG